MRDLFSCSYPDLSYNLLIFTKMADGVDIDLYDNLEDGFEQVNFLPMC